MCADESLEEAGDLDGRRVWGGALKAMDELLAKRPAPTKRFIDLPGQREETHPKGGVALVLTCNGP